MNKIVFLSLLIFLVGCGGDVGRPKGTPPEELSIFYSCDTRGYIEPCRCSSGQAGGISRRMAFLNENEPQDFLLVDAGDVAAGPRDFEVFEMEYVLRGYQAMGYHAVNAGYREASIDLKTLKELQDQFGFFVSANLLDATGERVFPAYRIVDFPNNFRVGILGVLNDTLAPAELGDGLRIAPPGDAIAQVLPELKEQVDFVVLLAFCEEETMRELVERFFEIDVIIGGNVIQPTRDPIQVNQSILVYVTDKGKAIGRLDLGFKKDGKIESSNDIHMLYDTLPTAPEAEEILDEFKVQLAVMDFDFLRDDEEGLTRITSSRSETANRFGDSRRCAECHPQAVEIWEKTKHAHAIEVLQERGHDHNPRCLKCHTVGFMATDGFKSLETTPILAGVGCGNCHGRGENHIRFHSGEEVPELTARLGSKDCTMCHDDENSPGFVF
ncbi:MAG: hypothetical protein KC994_22680, partial [Candidatus Omnitrophica bacterium]|nr:hypothetical protein [Candidatus Omnitrophota bacterium]